MNSSIAILTAENSNLDVPQDVSIMPILFSQGIFDDTTIHDFLIEEVLPANPTVLIIPASLGTIHTDYWGFRIGMHIRLTKALDNLRFIPLLFVSDDSLEEILVPQKEKLAVICSTPGSMLVRNDEGEINKALERLKPLDLTDYTNGFLKSITINRPDSTGKHSLANVWGVSRLAEATGLQHITKANDELNNRFKDLYFKYLQAFAESQSKQEGEIKLPELADIKAENKQILLIDDEADNGWGAVLNPLFKNKLTCISAKGKSFEEFYKEAKDAVKTSIWDLILLDLRLNPKEDVEGNEYKMASQYSGAKLLTHVKEQNGGNQVIMFTASNKTWNMQELLEMGADGYYVKESPELAMSPAFSRLTFNGLAKRANLCLDKDYLRKLYAETRSLKAQLSTKKKNRLIQKEFEIEVCRYLDYSFDSLSSNQQVGDTGQRFDVAFTFYFLILETYAKHFIDQETPVTLGDQYKFQFRKNYNFLQNYNEKTGRSFGQDLLTKKPGIPYNQKFYNLFGLTGLQPTRMKGIVDKRNEFIHPDLTTKLKLQYITLSKDDVLAVFEVIYKLTPEL